MTAKAKLIPSHFVRLAWKAARLGFEEVRHIAITNKISANVTFAT